MSERTTAEIVAELHAMYGTVPARAVREAADRLEALDAELDKRILDRTDLFVRFDTLRAEHAAIDALRPPCPTCGGSGLVATADSDGEHCRDCVQGRVSWERLVRVFTAVHHPDMDAYASDTPHDVLPYLRGIR